MSVLAVLVGLGFGIRALSSYRHPAGKGATGTLGSVLSIMDSTGVPTREEVAAAVEEQKQMRLEAYSAGPGDDGAGPYGGSITIRAQGRPAPEPAPGKFAGGVMVNSSINKDMRRPPLGSLEKLDDGGARLVFVRIYGHPVDKVWQAITNPNQTAKWWAQARGEAREGIGRATL